MSSECKNSKDDEPMLKVLLIGAVNGKFESFVKKLQAIAQKLGQLDVILCVGDFFSPDASKNENWKLALSALKQHALDVCILGPRLPEQLPFYQKWDGDKHQSASEADFRTGFELLEGLTCLGRKGVLATASGLRIGYLSGDEASRESAFTYTPQEVQQLIDSLTSADTGPLDLLVTSQFPAQILNHLDEQSIATGIQQLNEHGSIAVAHLARHCQPRYHFTCSRQLHFARQPFRNHKVLQEAARPVTRFISMAELDNVNKQKAIYAFNIRSQRKTPRAELLEQPAGTTENPYLELPSLIASNKQLEQTNGSFFWSMPNAQQQQRRQNDRNQRYAQHRERDHRQKQHHQYSDQQAKRDCGGFESDDLQQQKRPRVEQPCWFCLSSTEVDKSLVLSIGDFCYLALAKGGLVDEHLLLLPIAHCRTIAEIEDPEQQKATNDELSKFKDMLRKYFGQSNQLPIFFERNYKSQHSQMQIVPVPDDKSIIVTEVFQRLAMQRGWQIVELAKDQQIADISQLKNAPYFYFETDPDSRFCIPIRNAADFSLQFGRQVLAHAEVLSMPEREDWRNCVLDTENSKALVEKIRKQIQPFDFTL